MKPKRTCEDCGEPIDPARLQAVPHTRWCVRHAEAHVQPARAVEQTAHTFTKEPALPRGWKKTRR
jgi:RNA polymerase-binding transcription factor DksA